MTSFILAQVSCSRANFPPTVTLSMFSFPSPENPPNGQKKAITTLVKIYRHSGGTFMFLLKTKSLSSQRDLPKSPVLNPYLAHFLDVFCYGYKISDFSFLWIWMLLILLVKLSPPWTSPLGTDNNSGFQCLLIVVLIRFLYLSTSLNFTLFQK